MTLQKEDALHFIVLESETNIHYVLIQCDVPIKFLEVDKNNAVVSYSKCEPDVSLHIVVSFNLMIFLRLQLPSLTKQ